MSGWVIGSTNAVAGYHVVVLCAPLNFQGKCLRPYADFLKLSLKYVNIKMIFISTTHIVVSKVGSSLIK